MKVIKQTLLSLGVLAAITGAVALPSPAAYAQCKYTTTDAEGKQTEHVINTSIIQCPDGTNNASGNVEDNAIWKLLIMILNIMIAGVGILAVAGVVYASVLYATAADRADQVKKAKDIIWNVVIGVLSFGLMYSLLNFLIPGGIFN